MASVVKAVSEEDKKVLSVLKSKQLELRDKNDKPTIKLIDAEVGSGAFGKVYKVYHTIEKQLYAVKLINKTVMPIKGAA